MTMIRGTVSHKTGWCGEEAAGIQAGLSDADLIGTGEGSLKHRLERIAQKLSTVDAEKVPETVRAQFEELRQRLSYAEALDQFTEDECEKLASSVLEVYAEALYVNLV
jgi:hypothetical protein